MDIPMDKVISKMYDLDLNLDGPFRQTYVHNRKYFSAIQKFTVNHLVIGSTIAFAGFNKGVSLNFDTIDEATELVEKVRLGTPLAKRELDLVVRTIGDSAAVTSELLHLVNPRLYPMLDSTVLRFLVGDDVIYRKIDLGLYVDYREACLVAVKQPDFDQVYDYVCSSIGYRVPKLHALHLIMFLSGCISLGGRKRPYQVSDRYN